MIEHVNSTTYEEEYVDMGTRVEIRPARGGGKTLVHSEEYDWSSLIDGFDELAEQMGGVSKAMLCAGKAMASGLAVGVHGRHGLMSIDQWLLMNYGPITYAPSGKIASWQAALALLLAMLAVLAVLAVLA